MSQGDQQWGPDSAEGATSPSQQCPREPCRSHRGGRGQEQGTGAATCRSSTWFGDVLFGAGKRRGCPRGCPQVLQSPGSWAQEHPHLSRHRDFLGICFHKLNSFAAPPFPASSCASAPSWLHTQHSPTLVLPPRVTQSRMPRAQPLSPPGTKGHQEAPGRQRWHLPAASGLWISLPSRDSGSFQSHEPIEASGGSQEEGGSSYIPLPNNRKSRIT